MIDDEEVTVYCKRLTADQGSPYRRDGHARGFNVYRRGVRKGVLMAYLADRSSEMGAGSFSRRATLKAAGWLAAGAALLGARPSAADAAAATAQGEPLEGSWRSDLTREGLPPAVSLGTYMAGGTALSTANDPLLGPAHGVWARVGDREYDVAFVRPRWDVDRSYVGTRGVQARINVAEGLDTHTIASVVTDFDPAGNVVATRQVSGQATRIKLEPMS